MKFTEHWYLLYIHIVENNKIKELFLKCIFFSVLQFLKCNCLTFLSAFCGTHFMIFFSLNVHRTGLFLYIVELFLCIVSIFFIVLSLSLLFSSHFSCKRETICYFCIKLLFHSNCTVLLVFFLHFLSLLFSEFKDLKVLFSLLRYFKLNVG